MLSEMQSSQNKISGMVSFLCLCYNHSKYIKECLESILSQNLPSFEIIVLDDGSTDDSVGILRDFKNAHSCNMRIISQNNTGYIGLNFNRLIAAANGEYIKMSSCDDAVLPGSIAERLNILQNDKKIAFVCDATVVPVDSKGKTLDNFENRIIGNLEQPKADDGLELDFNDIGSYYVQSALYRTEILNAVGGFDENVICDDIIITTKIYRYLKKHPELSFKVMKKPCVYYRLHDSNISKNLLRQCRGLMDYYGRYWPDRKPPVKFLNLIQETALCYTSDELLSLFVRDSYCPNLLKNMETEMLFKESAVFRRRQGIPYVFEIQTYSKYKKKIRIIKFLGVKIFSWEENAG
ncbi:MAG: glycosyltransferase family 2 protein [Elusimicrobiales bacterium]|nr:glycosyltransferase family 2 protein [Elusimicrobiales bacterium]